MFNPLPRLMVQLTREDRYLPEFEWKKKAWVYNLFRLYELVFWRRVGIRLEQAVAADETGRVHRFFGTWEAVLHQLEQSIRNGIEFKWAPFRIYVPQIATPNGISFSSPYLFAIAFDTGNASNSAGDTGETSFTLAAGGANNKAIIFPMWETASAFGSITVNGSSTGVTQYGSEYSNVATNNEGRCYYLDNPPTSSVTYYIQAGSFTCRLTAAIYSGAATGTLDSSGTGTGTDTLSVSTTVVASNCWLTGIGIGVGGANNITAGTATTLRNSSQTTFFYSADSNATVGTGSQSLAWNKTSGTSMFGMVVSFAPAASGPANLKTYNTNTKANTKTINTNAIANAKTLDTNA